MALRVSVIIALVVATNYAVEQAQILAAESKASWAMPGLTIGLVVLYACLIAVPFMPGIEVGISILMMHGPDVAPLVWSATTLGLTMAYFVGRLIRLSELRGVFLDLRMTRVVTMIDHVAPLTPDERIDVMCARMPDWLGPLAIRFRYLTIAALINIPGNAMIGGGGGIAFVAGLSKVFRPVTTLITFGLAVAPVPIAVWVFGLQILEP